MTKLLALDLFLNFFLKNKSAICQANFNGPKCRANELTNGPLIIAAVNQNLLFFPKNVFIFR